jgi:hypothetical protein
MISKQSNFYLPGTIVEGNLRILNRNINSLSETYNYTVVSSKGECFMIDPLDQAEIFQSSFEKPEDIPEFQVYRIKDKILAISLDAEDVVNDYDFGCDFVEGDL